MTQLPRIRADLQASAATDQGINYFDVTDPKSGAHMRLYDFEWLLAAQMDGQRPFAELAAYARQSLGIAPSASDLEIYANQLRELGFFESGVAQPIAVSYDQNSFDEKTSVASSAYVAEATGERHATLVDHEGATEMRGAQGRVPGVSSAAVTTRSEHTPAPAPLAIPRGSSARIDSGGAAMPAKSKTGSYILLVLLLLGMAATVVYLQFFSEGAQPKVTTQTVQTREMFRTYETLGTVKLAPGQPLTFGESGKVSEMVQPGTEVKPGMPLGTLEGFTKLDKDIATVMTKMKAYEAAAQAAREKKNAPATAKAEGKAAEFKKWLTQLETKQAQMRLVAPGAGTVAEVLVTAGGVAKAGEPVLRLSDKRMIADFKLTAADAAGMKPGGEVSLTTGTSATMRTEKARIAKVEPGAAAADPSIITVELGETSKFAVGDNIRLVKGKLPNAWVLPARASVKHNGLDVVYVIVNGRAEPRPIKPVEKTATELIVNGGFAAGDQIIVSGVDALHDGEKVSTQ